MSGYRAVEYNVALRRAGGGASAEDAPAAGVYGLTTLSETPTLSPTL